IRKWTIRRSTPGNTDAHHTRNTGIDSNAVAVTRTRRWILIKKSRINIQRVIEGSMSKISVTLITITRPPQRNTVLTESWPTNTPLGGIGKITILIQCNPQPATGKAGVTIVALGISQSTTKTARLRCYSRIRKNDSNTITAIVISEKSLIRTPGIVIEFNLNFIVSSRKPALQSNCSGLIILILG